MSYRDFRRPAFERQEHTSREWLGWMQEQGRVMLPVAPAHERSCRRCYGAPGYIDGGPATWSECSNCRAYGDVIDCYVPITYCVDSGLESMLHRYKDFGVGWLARPLSALLHEFLDEHLDCLEEEVRGIDVATIVPSDNATRSFSHLEGLLRDVWVGDPLLGRLEWDLEVLSRDREVSRPARGEVKAGAYEVEPFVVENSSVLLLDDVWTSGASAASAAMALKEAGAASVAVVTLGRQLTPSRPYGSTEEIHRDSDRGEWRADECVLCV